MTDRPTLIINRFDSRCAACGKPANPYAITHDKVHGWGQDEDGCGVKWTHVTTHYWGRDMSQRVRAMRPDLEPIEITPLGMRLAEVRSE